MSGVFTRVDGAPLDPEIALFLYISTGTNGDAAGDGVDTRRGRGVVNASTGAFTADVADVPVGSSEIVFSFVLPADNGGDNGKNISGRRLRQRRGKRGRKLLRRRAAHGRSEANEDSRFATDRRRRLDTRGTGAVGSVHTVAVLNDRYCSNALSVRLQWDDGASDLDLWVYEPDGTLVNYGALQGVSNRVCRRLLAVVLLLCVLQERRS